jgi:hypothetical protein
MAWPPGSRQAGRQAGRRTCSSCSACSGTCPARGRRRQRQVGGQAGRQTCSCCSACSGTCPARGPWRRGTRYRRGRVDRPRLGVVEQVADVAKVARHLGPAIGPDRPEVPTEHAPYLAHGVAVGLAGPAAPPRPRARCTRRRRQAEAGGQAGRRADRLAGARRARPPCYNRVRPRPRLVAGSAAWQRSSVYLPRRVRTGRARCTRRRRQAKAGRRADRQAGARRARPRVTTEFVRGRALSQQAVWRGKGQVFSRRGACRRHGGPWRACCHGLKGLARAS